MEAARNFLSSPPTFSSRTHLKNFPSSSSTSSSVSVLREKVAPLLTRMPAVTVACYFATSTHISEQHEESGPSLRLMKYDRMSQATLDRRLIDAAPSANQGSDTDDPNHLKSNSHVKLLQLPGLWYLFQSLDARQSVPSKPDDFIDVEAENVVALAKNALSASREAALLAENSKLFGASVDDTLSPSLLSALTDIPLEKKTVHSTRLLQRQPKKSRVPKPKVEVEDTRPPVRPNLQRKAFDLIDPLRVFLSGPETKLLTVDEESELIGKIQDWMKLEEVKSRLQSQFNREPTLVEWAEAAGLSCRALQTQLHSGNRSREKLIYANHRMVVHIARQYMGRGLSVQDLLQVGNMGLMRSIEKFKPQVGCRFATYAYWWIRQAIRKAIFQHSRTIRLPDNVYGLLSKVKEAKKLCIQQGIHSPTKEEIASCAGITVEKLEKLLFTARMPLSMQQPVWMDQDTTFQEVTADTAIEASDLSVSKQLMRIHIRNLLRILNPKERKIIRLRFGIEDGKQKSLSEIGAVFGLSKERVRQLETRALYKLKQCLSSQGLNAYADMLL
ncbi:RNA polymerase sigma factor sigF, chloroplastic [Coffea eugenioides]|uniref:RNA polymerase sigma factor n=1 Tax=Coffea arabica TaxID=13443 RepID=A0A6P6SZU6_COFAR|nr:RNA polymerase sigma factor sigF, chloroplastic [Coffea eugenioides]